MKRKNSKKIEEENLRERKSRADSEWDTCYKEFTNTGHLDKNFLMNLAEKMRICNQIDREISKKGYRHLYE